MEADEFTCGSGEAVAVKDVCNGKVDCKDESDEVNCHHQHHYVSFFPNFFCLFKNILKVCDGKVDCDDGIDEKFCFWKKYLKFRLGSPELTTKGPDGHKEPDEPKKAFPSPPTAATI